MTQLALDHLIFGDGFGLASPYFSGRFYWLVDTKAEKRTGDLYTFMHGFGAQLHSFQWRCPEPGEERRLIGRSFRPFNISRRWGRVNVSWCTSLPRDIDAANVALRQIEADLRGAFIDNPLPWPRAPVAPAPPEPRP